MSLKRICVRIEKLKCPKIPHCPKIPVMTLNFEYLSQANSKAKPGGSFSAAKENFWLLKENF